MNPKIIEYLTNPTFSQILIEFQKRDMSAKELLTILPNIPPATLYRHVKKLYNENFLKIVDKKTNRGSVEKIYSLAVKLEVDSIEQLSQINTQQYYELFAEFCYSLLKEFNDYTKLPNPDIKNDGSGFSVLPIYASTEELKQYSDSIAEILKPALTKKHPEQKLHSFALVVTPPKGESD